MEEQLQQLRDYLAQEQVTPPEVKEAMLAAYVIISRLNQEKGNPEVGLTQQISGLIGHINGFMGAVFWERGYDFDHPTVAQLKEIKMMLDGMAKIYALPEHFQEALNDLVKAIVDKGDGRAFAISAETEALLGQVLVPTIEATAEETAPAETADLSGEIETAPSTSAQAPLTEEVSLEDFDRIFGETQDSTIEEQPAYDSNQDMVSMAAAETTPESPAVGERPQEPSLPDINNGSVFGDELPTATESDSPMTGMDTEIPTENSVVQEDFTEPLATDIDSEPVVADELQQAEPQPPTSTEPPSAWEENNEPPTAQTGSPEIIPPTDDTTLGSADTDETSGNVSESLGLDESVVETNIIDFEVPAPDDEEEITEQPENTIEVVHPLERISKPKARKKTTTKTKKTAAKKAKSEAVQAPKKRGRKKKELTPEEEAEKKKRRRGRKKTKLKIDLAAIEVPEDFMSEEEEEPRAIPDPAIPRIDVSAAPFDDQSQANPAPEAMAGTEGSEIPAEDSTAPSQRQINPQARPLPQDQDLDSLMNSVDQPLPSEAVRVSDGTSLDEIAQAFEEPVPTFEDEAPAEPWSMAAAEDQVTVEDLPPAPVAPIAEDQQTEPTWTEAEVSEPTADRNTESALPGEEFIEPELSPIVPGQAQSGWEASDQEDDISHQRGDDFSAFDDLPLAPEAPAREEVDRAFDEVTTPTPAEEEIPQTTAFEQSWEESLQMEPPVPSSEKTQDAPAQDEPGAFDMLGVIEESEQISDGEGAQPPVELTDDDQQTRPEASALPEDANKAVANTDLQVEDEGGLEDQDNTFSLEALTSQEEKRLQQEVVSDPSIFDELAKEESSKDIGLDYDLGVPAIPGSGNQQPANQAAFHAKAGNNLVEDQDQQAENEETRQRLESNEEHHDDPFNQGWAKPENTPAYSQGVDLSEKPAPPRRPPSAWAAMMILLLGVVLGAGGAYYWFGIEKVKQSELEIKNLVSQVKTVTEESLASKKEIERLEKTIATVGKKKAALYTGAPLKPNYYGTDQGMVLYWLDKGPLRSYYVYRAKGTRGTLKKVLAKPLPKNVLRFRRISQGTWRFAVSAVNENGQESPMSPVLTLRFPLKD